MEGYKSEGRLPQNTPGFGTGQPHPINQVSVKRRRMEVVRLLLEGAKVAEVASVMGLSTGTISGYLRDPEVRKEIAELNSQLLGQLDAELLQRFQSKQELIDEIATLALAEMRAIITSPTAHIGIKAKMIDSALDRCPEVSRTKKLDVTNRTFSMKAEDLLLAAQAAREVEEKEALKRAAEAAGETGETSEQNLVRD